MRGKKNLVIDKALAGPTGLFVKFSTLQQYGVNQVFYLENNNVNSSQRNVVFLSRVDNADRPLAIAGKIRSFSKPKNSWTGTGAFFQNEDPPPSLWR